MSKSTPKAHYTPTETDLQLMSSFSQHGTNVGKFDSYSNLNSNSNSNSYELNVEKELEKIKSAQNSCKQSILESKSINQQEKKQE